MAGEKTETLFISLLQWVACAFVQDAFTSNLPTATLTQFLHCYRSVAGLGVSGPLGPGPGISSGILPGSSSGRGGSPGSRIGGGASGFGLPGGIPGGGSVGVPGVAGGISGGSIGIYIATLRFSRRSGRLPVIAAAAIFT